MPYRDLTEYRTACQYLTLKGHNIGYWQAGTGPDILLIHGFPSAAWDWHHQWDVLRQHYRVTALDLLGYGLSDKPRSYPYTLIEQGDIVEQLLNALHISDTHIFAHDYGASVAQELLSRQFARRSSFNITSICWLNGGLFAELHRPLLTQKLLKSAAGPVIALTMGKSSLAKSLTKIFGSQTPPTPEDVTALWCLLTINNGHRVLPQLLGYIDERVIHRDRWVEAMQNTDIPLAFINGLQDPISGEHMANAFSELVPNGRLVTLDCGHYPQIERPEDVTQAYLRFIEA